MSKKKIYQVSASRICGSWTMQVQGVDDVRVEAVMLEYARNDLCRVLADRLGIGIDSFELAVKVEETP